MKIPSPRLTKRARIEIVPLIDVVFFLLATFVMVSLSMVRNLGIPVRLPVAASSAPQERRDHVSITVSATGDLHFNQETISLEALGMRLIQLKQEQPDPKVFIRGDAQTAFERIVTVLDETRKAGITKVAIETTKSR